MADHDEAAARRLRTIADLLGIPVEGLYDDAKPDRLWAAGECMRLWYRLRTDAGRDAALDALRRVLDAEAV